jgi:hypothetical protein
MRKTALTMFAILALALGAFASDQTVSKQLTIQVQTITGLALTPATLPSAIIINGVGQAYSATLTAAGGVAPYKWTLTGTLPAGLTMTTASCSATCAITGTPLSTAAASTFTIGVEDSTGTIAQIKLQWNASTSTVAGYNIYRGTASGGPYSKVNPAPIAALTYTDSADHSSPQLFYVATAVDVSGNESVNSNEAEALLQ